MRMLKCFLTTNALGHYVTAGDAVSTGSRVWSCASCGCGLILHAGSPQEAPWFEHDQRNVANRALMNCAYLEPEVKTGAKQRQLRSMPAELESVPPVMNWHCALCGVDYDGVKHCGSCGSGIYSSARVSDVILQS